MSTQIEITELYEWAEKYRPKSLDLVILKEEVKSLFETYIERKSIPNLLFYGPPGGGKSTVGRILVNNLTNRFDSLTFNGSGETGVDYLRNVVSGFCSTAKSSNHKIVFIEEFDRLSPHAQDYLKNPMDEFCEDVKFIFTTNHFNKIHEPIVSRCQTFKFDAIPLEEMKNQIFNILTLENINFTKPSVEHVIKEYYPDFRRTLNILQTKIVNNKLSNEIENIVSFERNIISNIKDVFMFFDSKDEDELIQESINTIGNIVSNNSINYSNVYDSLFKDSAIPVWVKPTICEYSDKHQFCVSEVNNFMSMIYSIYKLYKLEKNVLY